MKRKATFCTIVHGDLSPSLKSRFVDVLRKAFISVLH